MDILTDTKVVSTLVLKNETDTFPQTPELGELCFKSGVLYIYSNVDGSPSWHPLTNKAQHTTHIQASSNITWEIEHNLGTKDLIYFVYNDDDEMQLAEIEFDGIDPTNKVYIKLTEAMSGRCVLFAASNSYAGSGGDTSGVPTGSIMYFAAVTPPEGFDFANGGELSRTEESTLFDVIGETFGAGDGSTTFNKPNIQGCAIRGWDEDRGLDAGRAFGSYQGDAFASHRHYVQYRDTAAGAGDYNNAWDTMTSLQSTRTLYSNYVGGTETRMKNIALLPCIKL